MSLTAARQSRQTRRSCQSCRQRKARFQYRGAVRADRDHALCFACYRSLREHRRAQGLTDQRPATVPRSPFPAPLTNRRIAHRRAMLAHLERIA